MVFWWFASGSIVVSMQEMIGVKWDTSGCASVSRVGTGRGHMGARGISIFLHDKRCGVGT